jgi:uncharacterized iron-regulated protein
MKNTSQQGFYLTASALVAPARRCAARPVMLSALLLASAIGLSGAPLHAQAVSPVPVAEAACSTHGVWVDVKTGKAIDGANFFGDLAAKSTVVLLGESHTDADHHRWQLHTLAALHGRTDKIAVGFEAFPRRLQSVLDDWVAGKLTADAFLAATEWRRVWGYDAALYMPMFEFARLNRIPMIALNVERKLVGQVGQNGWAAVPVSEREGLSNPAPASVAYQRELAGVYQMKKKMAANPAAADRNPEQEIEIDEATFAAIVKEPEFQHFVEAQLTWDRAMAQVLAETRQKLSGATVVGIVGAGHVEGGYGIPHQLKDLAVTNGVTLLPESTKTACKLVGTSYADAIFTLAPASAPPPDADRPRLGVMLTNGEGGSGARVRQVVPNSVAEATGLREGDQVVRAAGLEMRNSDDLVDVVGRQAPGTWLPLSIQRDGQEIELIAKFPARLRPAL